MSHGRCDNCEGIDPASCINNPTAAVPDPRFRDQLAEAHVHDWTDWVRPAVLRDSFGVVIDSAGVAIQRLTGIDQPVTPAWWRTCRTCPSEESAFPAVQAAANQRDDVIDVDHLDRQRVWSRATFGPGDRRKGVLDHIRKELVEIEEAGERTDEWFDVVILALDGAWRDGYEPAEIIAAIKAKQAKNERRTWPDWRTADPDRAIEHVRESAFVAVNQRAAGEQVRVDYLCIGHPGWPDPLVVGSEERAREWLEQYGGHNPRVRVDKRTTIRAALASPAPAPRAEEGQHVGSCRIFYAERRCTCIGRAR